MTDRLNQYMNELPLIAILRGITPQQSESVVEALYAAGFRIVEVPLNSPDALDSIERIAKQFGGDMLVGAGTVLKTAQVTQVKARGGQMIVSPHTELTGIDAGVTQARLHNPAARTPSPDSSGTAVGTTAAMQLVATAAARLCFLPPRLWVSARPPRPPPSLLTPPAASVCLHPPLALPHRGAPRCARAGLAGARARPPRGAPGAPPGAPLSTHSLHAAAGPSLAVNTGSDGPVHPPTCQARLACAGAYSLLSL